MKKLFAFCALLIQPMSAIGCSFPQPLAKPGEVRETIRSQFESSREWGPATYRGLTIGKSTQADMLRIFGKPKWSGPPGDQEKRVPNPEVWHEYDEAGEFPGTLTIIVDKHSGVILEMSLSPKHLSKEEAIKHFGSDYRLTRYDSDNCLSDVESLTLYESPNGEDLRIEYRKRGLALSINYEDRVNQST